MEGNNPRLKLVKAECETDLTSTSHSMGDMPMHFFEDTKVENQSVVMVSEEKSRQK